MCPTADYSLAYDSTNGDTCVSISDASVWMPPVGCQDSLYVVTALNGVGKAPRIVAGAFSESAGHTNAWGSYVERVQVQSVEGDGSAHFSVVMYNGRGGEVQVDRVLHWGHNSVWVFFKCTDASNTPSNIFNVGDTMHVRRTSRTAPHSVLPGTTTPCDVRRTTAPSSPPVTQG